MLFRSQRIACAGDDALATLAAMGLTQVEVEVEVEVEVDAGVYV